MPETPFTLRLDEQDARDLAFWLQVAAGTGHLDKTYQRCVEMRGRVMSLVYDQSERYAAQVGWDDNEGWVEA